VFLQVQKGIGMQDPHSWGFLIYHGLIWMAAMAYLIIVGARQKTNAFCASLPLSTRRIWFVQMSVIALTGLLFLTGVIGITLLINSFATFTEPWFLIRSGLVVWVVYLLSAIVMQLVDRPYSIIRPGRVQILWCIGVGLLGYKLIEYLLGGSWLHLGSISLITFMVAWGFTQILPNNYVAPTQDEGEAVQAENWNGVEFKPISSLRRRLIFWNLLAKKPFFYWFGIPFVFLFGMMCSNLDDWGIFHHDQQLVYSLFSVYLLLAFFGASLFGDYRLDPFPISKRYIFRLITIPLLLAQLLGMGVAEFLDRHLEKDHLAVDFSPNRKGVWRLTSMLEHADWTLDHTAPTIQAPWGESQEAWSKHVIKGVPLTVFSPFSTTRESSPDFIAYQLSRAIDRIYNEKVAWEKIREDFLVANNQGACVLNQAGQTFLQQLNRNRPASNIHALPVLFGFTMVVWMFFVRRLVATSNSRYTSAQQKRRFWILLGILFALHICAMLMAVSDLIRLDTSRTLFAMIVNEFSATWFGKILLWVLPLGFAAWSYRKTESHFKNLEFGIDQGCML